MIQPSFVTEFSSALCAQVDPEAWFPEKGGSNANAKMICNRCPEIEKCLEDALTQPLPWFGIRGGTSERDRAVISKERRRAVA